MFHGRVVRIFTCAVLAGAGCGRSQHTTTPTTTTVTASTTSTAPTASVSVRPAAGPVGTTFTLTVTHFPPGETLRFDIGLPNGKIFKGQFHQVPSNGTVVAPYKTTSPNDPPGSYSVKAATEKGTSATGSFTLTPIPSTSAGPATGSPSTVTTKPAATTGH